MGINLNTAVLQGSGLLSRWTTHRLGANAKRLGTEVYHAGQGNRVLVIFEEIFGTTFDALL